MYTDIVRVWEEERGFLNTRNEGKKSCFECFQIIVFFFRNYAVLHHGAAIWVAMLAPEEAERSFSICCSCRLQMCKWKKSGGERGQSKLHQPRALRCLSPLQATGTTQEQLTSTGCCIALLATVNFGNRLKKKCTSMLQCCMRIVRRHDLDRLVFWINGGRRGTEVTTANTAFYKYFQPVAWF